jgi:hypothetical protein
MIDSNIAKERLFTFLRQNINKKSNVQQQQTTQMQQNVNTNQEKAPSVFEDNEIPF